MKKIITALVLASVMLFAGCSCNSLPALSFSRAWTASELTGTTETAIYKFEFDENFTYGDGFNYSKSSSIKDFKTEFTDGLYKTEITVVEKSDVKIDGVPIESDILTDPVTDGAAVIYLKTTAKVKAQYSVGSEKSDEYNDEIVTESYFLRTDMSLAPVYSRKIFSSSYVKIGIGNETLTANYGVEQYARTILYNKSSYTINTYAYDDYKAYPSTAQPKETKTYDYSFRTVIDASSLLFAIRNVNVEKDSTVTMPVVDGTFGTVQKLAFKNNDGGKIGLALKVNSDDKATNDISTDCISFGINATNTGRQHLAFIQNAAIDNVTEDKALLIKYVEPLTDYNSYCCLGAMVFTLSEISYS